MSNLFTPIEGSAVILYSKGLYKQSELFKRGGELYAKHGGGYIRLMNSGYTSYGDVKWGDVDLPAGVKIKVLGVGAVKIVD